MDDMTPEVARAEIDRLRGSEEIKNVMHPSHDRALQSLAEMYAKLHPEETAPPTETPGEAPSETPTPTPQVTSFEGVPEGEVQGLADLKSEWGAEFDAKIQQAQGVATQFTRKFGDEFVDWMETSRAGSNPLIIKTFAALASGQPAPDISADQARELIEVLKAGGYYGRGNSLMHDALHNIITKLYEVGFGGE
jgi:hypothetical protein